MTTSSVWCRPFTLLLFLEMKVRSSAALILQASAKNLEASARGKRLSSEVDQNGYTFVLASDGTTTFGEMIPETGLTPVPIKLSEGDGNTYGLKHVQKQHGKEIASSGFASVQGFIESVARNYTVVMAIALGGY